MTLNSLLAPPGYWTNFHGRKFGKYRARVGDNNDPKRLGRVRVYCDGIYGTELSPWCEACFAGGHLPDSGTFDVAPNDSMVWIEFEEGSVDNPIWTGGFPAEFQRPRPSDGSEIENASQRLSSSIPRHFQGVPDGTDFDGGVRGTPGAPETGYRGEYPYVSGRRTQAGNGVEFDDTPGAHRTRLMHSSGSMLEFLHDGSAHLLSSGTLLMKGQESRTEISGTSRTHVGGRCELTVDGDYELTVLGAYRVSYGRATETAAPSITLSADELLRLTSQGALELEAGGLLRVSAGGRIQVTSGDRVSLTSAGAGEMLFGNYDGLANPFSYAATYGGIGGRTQVFATDISGVASKVGIEAIPSAAPAAVGRLGPLVRLGNLQIPAAPDFVPLVQEPVVMGTQLTLFLQQLVAAIEALVVNIAAHTHTLAIPANTAVPSVDFGVSSAPALAAMSAARATFLTPVGPKLQPLMLSNTIAVSRD